MPKILCVEDDIAIAELIRRWLDEENHEVVLARNGPKALELAEAEQPDLILLDIDLGKFSIDGWEVHRKLKADPSTRQLPVVALTAHAQREEHRGRALREGFIDHISKPVTFETLIERVGACLAARGGS